MYMIYDAAVTISLSTILSIAVVIGVFVYMHHVDHKESEEQKNKEIVEAAREKKRLEEEHKKEIAKLKEKQKKQDDAEKEYNLYLTKCLIDDNLESNYEEVYSYHKKINYLLAKLSLDDEHIDFYDIYNKDDDSYYEISREKGIKREYFFYKNFHKIYKNVVSYVAEKYSDFKYKGRLYYWIMKMVVEWSETIPTTKKAIYDLSNQNIESIAEEILYFYEDDEGDNLTPTKEDTSIPSLEYYYE